MTTILVGGGHVHIGVLRQWCKAKATPRPVTLVTPSTHFCYSGMIPGWIAGHYADDAYRIDLVPLAHKAAVDLRIDTAWHLDIAGTALETEADARLDFDLLSLGTGGVTDCSLLAASGNRLIAAKPIEEFIAWWRRIRLLSAEQPGRIAVVGGGAAAVELAAAMAFALRSTPHGWTVAAVVSRQGLLTSYPASVRRRANRALDRLGVTIIEEDAAGDAQGLLLSGGDRLAADWVVAATGVQPPAWLQNAGLALKHGYPVVGPDQRSISHGCIFAAGDLSSPQNGILPKAGVQAVRQAPIMAHNLIAAATGAPLRRYRPRRKSLYLIALGDRRALLSWGRLTLEGRLVWRLKDWIDRRYVGKSTA